MASSFSSQGAPRLASEWGVMQGRRTALLSYGLLVAGRKMLRSTIHCRSTLPPPGSGVSAPPGRSASHALRAGQVPTRAHARSLPACMLLLLGMSCRDAWRRTEGHAPRQSDPTPNVLCASCAFRSAHAALPSVRSVRPFAVFGCARRSFALPPQPLCSSAKLVDLAHLQHARRLRVTRCASRPFGHNMSMVLVNPCARGHWDM